MLLALLLNHIVKVRAATCTDPSNFTPPASPADYTFNIGIADYSFTIPAWTWDNGIGCVETLTISPVSNPTVISFSTRTVTIHKDGAPAAMHGQSRTFTVTSTLDDSTPTTNSGYTFTIIMNDLC